MNVKSTETRIGVFPVVKKIYAGLFIGRSYEAITELMKANHF